MVNKVAFVGFRGDDRPDLPPPVSASDDTSARLLVRTRACTHLSITLVNPTFTY